MTNKPPSLPVEDKSPLNIDAKFVTAWTEIVSPHESEYQQKIATYQAHESSLSDEEKLGALRDLASRKARASIEILDAVTTRLLSAPPPLVDAQEIAAFLKLIKHYARFWPTQASPHFPWKQTALIAYDNFYSILPTLNEMGITRVRAVEIVLGYILKIPVFQVRIESSPDQDVYSFTHGALAISGLAKTFGSGYTECRLALDCLVKEVSRGVSEIERTLRLEVQDLQTSIIAGKEIQRQNLAKEMDEVAAGTHPIIAVHAKDSRSSQGRNAVKARHASMIPAKE